MSGLHIGDKPHVWVDGVCQRCAMRSHWAGAKAGCAGIVTKEEHQSRNRRHAREKGPRKPLPRGLFSAKGQMLGPGRGSESSPLRAEVEALGLRWDLYYERRRRGRTHEEAIAGVDRRRRAADAVFYDRSKS